MPKRATLYRMVMPGHICPFGLKSLDLLKRKGFEVDDHWLRTRAETDAYKAAEKVGTTPQTLIGGTRIGGYDDLRRHFGLKVADPGETSYRPVLTVFAVALLLALAAGWAAGGIEAERTVRWFVSFAMCLLAMLKLQDVEAFSTMFLNYDLLARRWVPYAYIYPYAELVAGVLMAAGVLTWLSVPVAALIGGIGAISVVKAVYIDKRELRCACVGGSAKTPLGFVSLTENLAMLAMAAWMAAM